jgi:predicted metal-dependent hydrolase
MIIRRLDDNTVQVERDGESIIILYPKGTPSSEIINACTARAEGLEKKTRIYRDLCEILVEGVDF